MWSVETGRRPLRLAEASDLAKVLHIQVTDLLRSEAESAVLTYSDRILEVHLLRHYYASLLIRHGESVKTVQARLGHASATETLDTYAHLWPDSEDRTREAVDSVLGAVGDVPLADTKF